MTHKSNAIEFGIADPSARRQHDWLHVRHNTHWDVHQCQTCGQTLHIIYRRGGRNFTMAHSGGPLMKPTKGALRCEYTPEQSHDRKTDRWRRNQASSGLGPFDYGLHYGCPGYLIKTRAK